jgi:peptidoglycan/LPS O-acetylase OafA/YrhL
VILMTAERKRTVRAFAVSRFTRLMPAFVVALMLATTILVLAPMPPLLTPTPRQFLANLTMAPILFMEAPIDLPYWTLTYELVFYGYMALILRFGLLHSIEWIGLLAVAVGCLGLLTMNVEQHHRTAILLMLHYGNFFVIGLCLYRLYSRAARPITYLTLISAVLATAMGGGERTFYASGSLYLSLASAFALLVWFATSKQGRWLVWPPLLFFGRISYALYLVHVVVGFQIIHLGTELGWSTIAGIIAAGLGSIAVATVLHYLVEVPVMRWSRDRLETQRQTVMFGPFLGPTFATRPVSARTAAAREDTRS